jgi:hypothetical protein
VYSNNAKTSVKVSNNPGGNSNFQFSYEDDTKSKPNVFKYKK